MLVLQMHGERLKPRNDILRRGSPSCRHSVKRADVDVPHLELGVALRQSGGERREFVGMLRLCKLNDFIEVGQSIGMVVMLALRVLSPMMDIVMRFGIERKSALREKPSQSCQSGKLMRFKSKHVTKLKKPGIFDVFVGGNDKCSKLRLTFSAAA